METIVSVFAERARVFRDRVAVGDLSYAELDARTNQLAHRLIRAGVEPGAVVGVRGDRSVQTIVMLLAVLKAGAGYLALDRRQPAQRQEMMLAEASVRVVLAEDGLPEGPGYQVIHPGHDEALPVTAPEVRVAPESLAYVAYTSGSTGRPKGVCVPHRAVLRLVLGSDVLDISSDDVFLHFAPVAFDASTLEVWGSLLNGARLAVAPPGELALPELLEFTRAEQVTVLWLTAGLFHRAVDSGLPPLPSLRYLLAGGDVLSPSHVNRAAQALPHVSIVNGYGPTENTTFTCCHTVSAPVGDTVPIGRAISGTRTYLLDEALSPVPAGQVGELYAAGLGLAHGYLGKPGETATRFVADPFDKGERMYRTGDLARQRGDVLEFLGRQDSQVKIRGFRVELDEVATVLSQHPDVLEAAVVTAAGATGRTLVACIVGRPSASVLEIRGWLATRLPEYAVPARIRVLLALPLNANGKLDRAALERLDDRTRPEVNAEHREPQSPLERSIVDLWGDRLGLAGIGADDDFFELGGDSLIAVTIITELEGGFGVQVSPLDFYLDPSPAGLARTLTAAGWQP
ncbi:MAG: non-ribosomal peptide synthetase [Jatrophihabitantaceae bacterium]